MEYKNILTGVRGSAGIITLNRPKALNAVCESMLEEIAAQLKIFEEDSNIAAIIIRGSDKAFAAGIDLRELQAKVSDNAIEALDDTYKYFRKIEDKCCGSLRHILGKSRIDRGKLQGIFI